jgi:hypothetical protein
MRYHPDHPVNLLLPLTASSLKRLLIFMVMLAVRVFSFDPFTNNIPADENEAALLLEAHEIDSIAWLFLEPFYQHPLQVPSGELSLLLEIFPELEDQLPADREELNRYLPWDDDAIERFLEDFPIVNRFKPIVQFTYREKKNANAVAFHLHHTGYDSAAVNSMHYDLGYGRTIRAGGSIEFSNTNVRMNRRNIVVSPFPQCKISLGNQQLFSDKGLLYGYFPAEEGCPDDTKHHWLYSTSPAWNGVGVNVSPSNKNGEVTPTLGFFWHHRPAESVSGASIVVNTTTFFSGTLGITNFRLNDDTFRKYYVHGSLRFMTDCLSSEIIGAFNVAHEVKVPFIWENRLHNDTYVTYLTVMHFPYDFSAPRSELLRRFRHEMEIEDTPSCAMTFLRVNYKERKMKAGSLYPQVDIWFYGKNVHHGKLILKAEKKCNHIEVELEYSQKFGTGKRLNAFGFEGEARWKIMPPFSIITAQSFDYSDDTGVRYRGTIQPSVTFLSMSMMEPFVKIIARNRSLNSLYIGYRHKVMLFERTHTEFYIEKSMWNYYGGRFFRLEGNASFLF